MNFGPGQIDNLQVLIENQTLTTSGSVQVKIDTSQYRQYWLTYRIDGPVTGSSPTIEFQLYDQDSFGVSVTSNVSSSGVISTPLVAQSFKHFNETGLMQLNWVITGTTPSFGGVYVAIVGVKDARVTGQMTMADSTPVVIASDQSPITVTGTVTTDPDVNIHDGAGNSLTSQINGTQRALDVGIDVAGVQIDPRSIRALTSGTDSITAVQGTSPWISNVNNGAGASAVNIQDGGNSITVDGAVSATQGTNPWVTDVSQFGGSVVVTGTGASGAGIPRVTVSNDSNILATQSGTWNINDISGAISLPTGAATSANQTTEITSLQILDDVPASFNAAFSKGNTIMGQLDDTGTIAATEDNVAPVRITAQRAVHTNLRNNTGTEIATSANPLRIDPTGTTIQPVSDLANGPVTPGSVATKSELIGGQYNSSFPVLTNGQQSAVQLDSSGRIITNTTIGSVATTVAPSLSHKIKAEPTFTTIAIPSSVSYTTLFSYSGSGYFLGFNYEFNNTSIVIKLVIDGNTVLDGSDIGSWNSLAVTSNATTRYQAGQGVVASASVFDFSTRYPIAYTSSVVISARLTSGSTSRNFQRGVVYIQKDT